MFLTVIARTFVMNFFMLTAVSTPISTLLAIHFISRRRKLYPSIGLWSEWQMAKGFYERKLIMNSCLSFNHPFE